MTRLFLEETLAPGRTLRLTGEKARYLITVLRSKLQDRLLLTDGSGASYTVLITGLTKKEVTLQVEEPLQESKESPLSITLVQGLLKGEKMDLVIQKAVELGTAEIRPVITARCQVRETRKRERWQKIAGEAARQCGRSRIPQVYEPELFSNLLKRRAVPAGLICWEEERTAFSEALSRFMPCSSISLCIGPEGGFAKEEIDSAAACGFSAASLGRRILRAETAALSTLAVVQYLLGDLSKGA